MLPRNVSKRVSCDASAISISLFIGTATEIFESVLEFQFLRSRARSCTDGVFSSSGRVQQSNFKTLEKT